MKCFCCNKNCDNIVCIKLKAPERQIIKRDIMIRYNTEHKSGYSFSL